MAPKNKKTAQTTITTREELEARMGDLSRVTIERAKLSATMNKLLDDIRARYDAAFAEHDEFLAAALADLEAWAALNPGEFASKKSVELLHGVLGYRTGTPALKPIKGVRWEDVMILLRRHPGYIRTSVEPDKAAIIGDRDGLGEAGLAALGLRIEQAERFYAEPKIEQEA